MNKKISTQQFAFLLFFLLQGSSLFYIPEAGAGRDAWIANILASLLGFYVLFAFLGIHNKFPGISVLRVSELALGKAAGKTLNLLFVCVIFTVALRYLHNQVIILNIIYRGIPDILFQSVLILAAACCIYKGLINIARLAELFIWVSVFLFFLSFIIAYNLMDPMNLTPVLADVKPVIAGAFYAFAWPYAELSLLAVFLPFISDLGEKKRFIYYWYFLAAIILLFKTAISIAIMGPEILMAARVPFYEIHRLIDFADFLRRVELFFFFPLLIMGFIASLLAYKSFLLGLKELFSLKQFRPLILPVGLLIIILTNYIFPSDLEYLQEAEKTLPLLTVPFYLFYPSIILLTSRIREKHIRKQLNSRSFNT